MTEAVKKTAPKKVEAEETVPAAPAKKSAAKATKPADSSPPEKLDPIFQSVTHDELNPAYVFTEE